MSTAKQDANDLRTIAATIIDYAEKYPQYDIVRASPERLETIAVLIEEEEAKRQALHDHFHKKQWLKVFREMEHGVVEKVIESESHSWFVSMKVANVYSTKAQARSVAYLLWGALDVAHKDSQR